MAFKHPAKVIGNLCYLTPMSTEFAPEMAHFLADYSVAKFVRSFPSNYPIEKEIELIQNKVNDKTSRMFAVIDRVTEKFIGTCEICKIDTVDRTGEIGIIIGDKDFLGKGYGTEAHAMLLDFCFTVLGIENIMLTYVDENSRAGRSYSKLGYEVFGTWPFSRFFDGKKCSRVYAYVTPEKFYDIFDSFLNK